MGRHGAPRSRTRSGLLAVVAALVVGLFVGWAATQALGGDDATTAGSSAEAGEGDGAADGAKGGATGSEEQLEACTAELEDAEAVLDATSRSARSWKLHVEAQTRRDSGELTQAESKKQWADSKARGPGDIERYDSAVRSAKATSGDCSGTEDAGEGGELGGCTERLAAVEDAVAKGTVVHKQWVAHQKMMAEDQGTMDTEDYLHKWHEMVEDAEEPLEEFASAKKKVEDAPACA